MSNKPWDSTSGKTSYGFTEYARLAVVNLSPRQWVHLPLQGVFGDQDEVRLLAGWRCVAVWFGFGGNPSGPGARRLERSLAAVLCVVARFLVRPAF